MDKLNLLINKINKNSININNLSNKIKNIVEEYDGKDWEKYIVKTEDNYYKNLIYNNDEYEMFVVSWMPNKNSTIHDHPKNGCVFKILKGSLIEERYELNTINYINEDKFEKGDVSFISNEMSLHKVRNDNDFITVSLHIYSPPKYKIKSYERGGKS